MLHIALDIIYTLTTRERDITWRLQDRGVLMDAVGFFFWGKEKKVDDQEVKNCEKLFTLQWNSLL